LPAPAHAPKKLCPKLNKGLCIDSDECEWIIGQGCRAPPAHPKKVNVVKKNAPKKVIVNKTAKVSNANNSGKVSHAINMIIHDIRSQPDRLSKLSILYNENLWFRGSKIAGLKLLGELFIRSIEFGQVFYSWVTNYPNPYMQNLHNAQNFQWEFICKAHLKFYSSKKRKGEKYSNEPDDGDYLVHFNLKNDFQQVMIFRIDFIHSIKHDLQADVEQIYKSTIERINLNPNASVMHVSTKSWSIPRIG
jgi:hypothetical protein